MTKARARAATPATAQNLDTTLPPDPPECGSVSTAIEAIRRMFVDTVQYRHITGTTANGDPGGPQTPAKRAAFIKQHGGVYATFQVNDDLDEKYRVGIFQPGAHYTAWIRFSSDKPDYVDDYVDNGNATTGVGIKLFGVSGPKLEADAGTTTLDLVLQNTTSFFASDATEMCGFKTAALNGYLPEWRQTHPVTDKILTSMSRHYAKSLLSEKVWSCIPYKFGDDNYCKYVLVPELDDNGINPDLSDPNYLAADLQARLAAGPARFSFQIQLRNDPDNQSIINASDIWNEGAATDDPAKSGKPVAKPVTVATLYIPQQDINVRGQADYSETLSYSIWRTLPEMAPVGSIAEARKVVYESSAKMRRDVNGQPAGEPVAPRPPGPRTPPFAPESTWPDSKKT